MARISWKNYQEHAHYLNPDNRPLGRTGVDGNYQLDHIIPLSACSAYGVEPEFAGAKENLQVIPWRLNVLKGARFIIDDLLELPESITQVLSRKIIIEPTPQERSFVQAQALVERAYKWLDLSGLENLEALPSKIKQKNDLVKLSLANTSVSRLDMISSLFRMRKLNLSGTTIMSLDALVGLERLEELDISNTKILSIHPLARLQMLRVIKAKNLRVVNWKVLLGLRSLRELHVSGSNFFWRTSWKGGGKFRLMMTGQIVWVHISSIIQSSAFCNSGFQTSFWLQRCGSAHGATWKPTTHPIKS